MQGGRTERKLESDCDDKLRESLFGIEPELRRLDAVISNLSVLATAQDNIEPAALTVLVEVGGDAVKRVSNNWRVVFDLMPKTQHGTTN